MDPSIKSLTITGSAVEDANKSRRPVGSRKKRQSKMEEEEFIEQAKELSRQSSPIVQPPAAPILAATAVIAPVNVQIQKQEPVARPIISIPTAKEPIAQAPVVHIREERKEPEYDGGAKVILKPAKNPRVKLQPKHSSQSQTHSSGQNSQSQPHTRKARRFRLSVSSLTHRFTRAKRVKDDMENKPIHKIREYLVQKGVIQEKSKAPERMLRSMYKDFMLLKDTAL